MVCSMSLHTALRSATPAHGLQVSKYAYCCSVKGVSPLTWRACACTPFASGIGSAESEDSDRPSIPSLT